MNVISRRLFVKWMLPLVVACLAIVAPMRSVKADDGGVPISGSLSTHLVSCSTLCTSGTISGSLSGSFDYTMATMTPTADPDVVILTGSFVIANATGTLTGTDTTVWNVVTGQFLDLGKFTGGTGAYHEAGGKISIVGTFDIAAGTGQSDYTGKLKVD
jgi:hypothetical protein